VQLTQPEMQEQAVAAVPMLSLVDTHAHIHFSQFAGQVNHVLKAAQEAGVTKIVTVGVNTADSQRAVELAATYENVWATVGIHPHDADEADQGLSYLKELATRRKVVAIGECGLDYYRSQSSADDQKWALRAQVEVAQEAGLPLVFHVREAFDDFFTLMNDYPNLPGVVHSFTAGQKEMEEVLKRGWLIALNGITTFTKDQSQLEAIKRLPVERLLLETDCPFLSPAPHRGKTNEPARVTDIAAFLAELRGERLVDLAIATTHNAERFFKL
jgi:TatD DNase family protein